MDPTLVTAAQAGNQVAFATLAGALTPSFLAVSHRILRDLAQAEDATQQALVIVWQRLPQLRDPDRFEAWAYRLLVRACYAEAHRGRRWRAGQRVLHDPEAAATDDMSGVVDRDALDRAFGRLSLDHRSVVVLRHYHHLSLDEVAAVLGVSAGTVASRLHYALRHLRAALETDARPAITRVAR